jgi:phage terminase large subunit
MSDYTITRKICDEINFAVDNGYDVVSEQGSSRSGKTFNTLLWILAYVYTYWHKKITISIVRATLPALKGSVLVDFKDILGSTFDKCFNKTELIYEFENGSTIEFFSCDSEQKLRGRKRDILYCNEANELTYEMWQQLKIRTSKFAIIDYNPSFSDEHWICQLNKEANTYHFITTYKDNINPTTNESNIPQTIINEIESLKHKNPTLWQIYGEGKQAIVEGLVFPKFETIADIPTQIDKTYIGIDYGYTNDPTAIVEVGIEGENLYIREIAYQTHLMTNEIAQILKQQGKKVISESADPRMIDELARAGVNIVPVQKYKGSIEAGIAKMQAMKIHITKDSTNVIREFKNYTYEKNRDGKYLNTPIDMFNHAIDATRYVVLTTVMTRNVGGVRGAIAF